MTKTSSTVTMSSPKAAARPRVLLTDTERWASAARLAIALSEAGADVSFLCPAHHPIEKARGIARILNFRGANPLDSIQRAIESVRPEIIVPGDERSVQLLYELHSRAVEHGNGEVATLISCSLGSPESFPILSSRYEFLALAREEGLDVPETHAIREFGDLERLKESKSFPWVMKVDGTSAGRGVRFVQSPNEADQFFAKARASHTTGRALKRVVVNRDRFFLRRWWLGFSPEMIVQTVIQGSPANCAVMCWEGRVLAGISARTVRAYGSTGPASVIRIVYDSAMMLAAKRIARRLRLSGYFGLDFMIEEASGIAYLIEINPRCTPLCHLRLGEGRDMVGAALTQLSGKQHEAVKMTSDELIAYFPQAWLSNSEFLDSSFHDVPWAQPEYAQELLRRPWPDRSLLFTTYQLLWNRLFPADSESN